MLKRIAAVYKNFIKMFLPFLAAPNQHFPSLVNSASTDSLAEDRQGIRRISSSNILAGQPFVSVYKSVWLCLADLTHDPHPEVASMSKAITDAVKRKVGASTVAG